jgi:hypothetical protein
MSSPSPTSSVHTCAPRRIVASRQAMPKESTEGEIVWEPVLEGSYVVSRVLRRSEWVREGVKRDWRELAEEERKRIEEGMRMMQYMWTLNQASMDLMEYQLRGIRLPPSPYFVRLPAASPFFRTTELLTYHGPVTEAPWIETCNITQQWTPIPEEKEVRVGTFISLYDEELRDLSQRIDSPQFYGQVKEFIGYDGFYAVAVVTIMVYYRGGDEQQVSYQFGKRWAAGEQHFEETVVLLRRPRCHFPHMELLKFGPGELSCGYLIRPVRGTGFPERGPRRSWDGDQEWKHPDVIEKEEKRQEERERLRRLRSIRR